MMLTNEAFDRTRFGYQFVTLSRLWRQAIDLELTAAGLTDATWRPLVHLREAGMPLSQVELAKRIGLDASTLVRLIDLLSDRGLVERRVDPADRRARHLVLTGDGLTEVERIRAKIHETEAALLSDLDDETLALVSGVFDMIERKIGRLVLEEGTRPQS